MAGAENAKGGIMRGNTQNAGAATALKGQAKFCTGDEKALKKQERKQENKQLRTKEHSSGDRGGRSEGRGQNRGASGKRK
jgi:hypothetical protein